MNERPIEEKILNEIRARRVTMHSRSWFVLKHVALVVSLIIAACYVLYHASFILWSLHRSGGLYAGGIGWSGASLLLRAFPWIAGATFLLLVLALGLMIGRVTGAYRKPLLYPVLLTITGAVLGGIVIFLTPLNERVHTFATGRHLPFFESVYEDVAQRELEGTYMGIVQHAEPKGFTLEEEHGRWFTVMVSPDTKFPRHFIIVNGRPVLVIGSERGGTIDAEAIRGLPPRYLHDAMPEFEGRPLPIP